MAEILVRTQPTRDGSKRLRFLRVEEDGFDWGRKERSHCGLIKLPGVPIARLRKYLLAQYDLGLPEEDQLVRSKQWEIVEADLPIGFFTALITPAGRTSGDPDGIVIRTPGMAAEDADYTWGQFRGAIVDRKTDQRESMAI